MIEPFDDIAPTGDEFTEYDRTHVKLYLRLFDADADGADWREMAKVLFGIDPARDRSEPKASTTVTSREPAG